MRPPLGVATGRQTMKRALIASTVVLASMVASCGSDVEPSTEAPRHTVCDRLAVGAGKDTPGPPNRGPLKRTVTREWVVASSRHCNTGAQRAKRHPCKKWRASMRR
jgi:hypothetical protein